MIKTIIIILIYVFFIYSPKYKENFITWFLPYYNKSTGELIESTPPYITSNLELNYLEYNTFDNLIVNIKEKNMYYDFLFKNILKSLRIKRIFIRNIKNALEEVSDNPINTAIFSAPFIVNNINENIDKLKNINFVIYTNYRYLFFIVNSSSNISRLNEIDKKRINIGPENTDEYIFGKNIIENLNNKFKISPDKIFNYDVDTSFKNLINGEIDGMVFTDLFPSEKLNKIIEMNLGNKIILIPIEDINENIFLQMRPYVSKVFLDQNNLPKNYLPIKVKNLYFNKFRPNITSYKYPEIMVCNKNASPKFIFNIVKSIVSNLNIINQSDYVIKNQYNYLSFPDIANNQYIPVNVGAKLFYRNISINTTYSDDLCKYYVGNAKCTPELIEGARIIGDGD
jgi:TRAP-type uncharacterized transport system substrate-binding protein